MLPYQQTFSSIKSDVQWLIRENAHKEITPTTKYKTSGIYMIYIDKFDSETTIPIYIGQSVDMQRRHKEHTQGILALNRLSYEAYKAYFFEGNYSLYEGKFKACKNVQIHARKQLYTARFPYDFTRRGTSRRT